MVEAGRVRIIGWAVLIVALLLTLYPPLWMLSASFKTNAEVFSDIGLGLGAAGLENYTTAFDRRPFGLYLLNSILAAAATVAITLLLAILAGYGFAKFRFRGQEILWVIVLASFMVPLEAIVIPLFLQVHALGLNNSYAGLILPTGLNAVGIFILRQAILSVPDDYVEAARIDGAGEPRILWSVVVPLVAPSIAVVAILTFNLTWNSFLWPLVVVSDDSLRTLPIGMALFQSTFNTQYGQVMAVSVIGTLPTVLMFLFFQRSMLDGAIASGVR